MSFANYSHPECETPSQTRFEMLRDLRESIGRIPDVMKAAQVTCPLCGAAVDVRQGRLGKSFFFTHSPSSACAESGNMTRIEEADRQLAIEKFQEASV